MRIAIGFIFLALVGCGTVFKASPPTVVAVQSPKHIYPRPTPLVLRSVDWTVVSSSASQERDAYLSVHGSAMCLAPVGYENLAINMQEIVRFLKDQKALIEVYERERREDNAALP